MKAKGGQSPDRVMVGESGQKMDSSRIGGRIGRSSSPRWAVGIDPGASAGAVVLLADSGAVGAVWSWRRLGRTQIRAGRHAWILGELWRGDLLEGIEVCSIGRIGRRVRRCLLAHGEPVILTAEGLFGRGRTLNALAEATGKILGPLESLHLVSNDSSLGAYRPLAVEWRPRVLGRGCPRGATAAAAYAVDWARECYPALGALGAIEHVAEAAALATWGLMVDVV